MSWPIDEAKPGVHVGHRVDRKLRVIGDRVVLIGDVDGGDTGIGWLGAIERAVPSPQPRGVHPIEPLVDTTVGPVWVAEHQECDVRVLSCLHELDLLVDGDLRALRITLNEVGLARIDCLLQGHRGLQVRQTGRNRGGGERFGRGDQHRGARVRAGLCVSRTAFSKPDRHQNPFEVNELRHEDGRTD